MGGAACGLGWTRLCPRVLGLRVLGPRVLLSPGRGGPGSLAPSF